MTQRNKIHFILSFFVLLAPVLIGLFLKERLSAALGGGGVWMIILLPLFFFILHILCVGSMLYEKHKHNQSDKIVNVAIWISPAISAFVSYFTFSVVLGVGMPSFKLLYVIFGVLFILMGNYMPKAKRNHFFGVKTHFTLASDDIWMRTHRLAGKTGVITGILFFPCLFLPEKPVFLIVAILSGAFVISFVPMIYSFVLYKKALKAGTLKEEEKKLKKSDKIGLAISIPLIIIAVTIAALMSFTGNITFSVNEESVFVDATMYSDKEIAYSEVESVTLIEDTGARRISGFGSPRLSMGLFKSEALGNHTRYAYTEGDVSVLLTLKAGGRIVLRCESEAETTALYEAILEKTK